MSENAYCEALGRMFFFLIAPFIASSGLVNIFYFIRKFLQKSCTGQRTAAIVLTIIVATILGLIASIIYPLTMLGGSHIGYSIPICTIAIILVSALILTNFLALFFLRNVLFPEKKISDGDMAIELATNIISPLIAVAILLFAVAL
ncbi:MAG: hypothetical protein HQM10_19040 [Candidatus Riflebacteria bacterium]|nr:hypothetical protein [Candidatus Riflebacteria bacterium]